LLIFLLKLDLNLCDLAAKKRELAAKLSKKIIQNHQKSLFLSYFCAKNKKPL